MRFATAVFHVEHLTRFIPYWEDFFVPACEYLLGCIYFGNSYNSLTIMRLNHIPIRRKDSFHSIGMFSTALLTPQDDHGILI